MTVDEEIDVAIAIKLSHRDCTKSSAFVSGAVFAAGIRASMSKLARPIRVKRAKCPDCQSIPHHRPDHTIAAIFFVAQAVSMLDARPPPGEVARPRAEVVVHSNIVTQNVAAPAVVVAGYPENLESAVAKL